MLRFTEPIPEDLDSGTWTQRTGHLLKRWLMSAQESLGGLQGTPDTPNNVLLSGSPSTGSSQAPMPSDATLVLDQGGATVGQVLEWDGSAWVPTTPSSGGANTVRVTAAFGASFTDKAQTVVTGEAWVGLTSCLSGLVVAPTGVDPDEIRLLDFQVVISDLVAGDGFTVTVYSEPEAKGNYEVMVIGA